MKPYRWKRVLGICTAAVLGLSFPAYAVTITPLNPGTGQSSSSEPSGTGAPASQENTERLNIAQPVVSSEGAVLMDGASGKVLFSKNGDTRYYPASITKVMTALLTLEHGNMDDEITLKHDINLTEDGAVISTLTKGDTVTVGQVFHTMLIKSANDCAVILAEYVAGSEAKFIDMMNERARELGATHTHFVNPNGLHNNDHYTTAYDLYLIFKEAVKHEEFVDTVSSKDYTMTYTTAKKTQINEYMQSTNYYLLNEFPVPEGVVMYGGKTGTTSMAKSCLILMTKNKKGERFFSVVLGAETKEALYSSMTRLLEKTTN